MSKRQCILYLSIIRDFFDNSIVAYKTGVRRLRYATPVKT